MIYAFWMDLALLAVWAALYCAEEVRRAVFDSKLERGAFNKNSALALAVRARRLKEGRR